MSCEQWAMLLVFGCGVHITEWMLCLHILMYPYTAKRRYVWGCTSLMIWDLRPKRCPKGKAQRTYRGPSEISRKCTSIRNPKCTSSFPVSISCHIWKLQTGSPKCPFRYLDCCNIWWRRAYNWDDMVTFWTMKAFLDIHVRWVYIYICCNNDINQWMSGFE